MGSEGSGTAVPGRYVFQVRAGYAAPLGYVAMGDSYSSGVGTGVYNLSALSVCARSTQAWPQLLSNEYPTSPELLANSFFACTGASMGDLLTDQLPELKSYVAAHGSPALVTLTTGGDGSGNSGLSFAPLLASCVEDGSAAYVPQWFDNCLDELQAKIAYVQHGSFEGQLESTYSQVKQAAGNSEVVAVGYPDLFPAPGETSHVALHCAWLKYGTTQFLSDFRTGQQDVDSAMQEAANQAGITFVPLGDLFAGHELCTGSPYINTLDLGSGAGHPNDTGYQLMAASVASQLGYLANDPPAALGSSMVQSIGKEQPVRKLSGTNQPPAQKVTANTAQRSSTEAPTIAGDDPQPLCQ